MVISSSNIIIIIVIVTITIVLVMGVGRPTGARPRWAGSCTTASRRSSSPPAPTYTSAGTRWDAMRDTLDDCLSRPGLTGLPEAGAMARQEGLGQLL
jgi:hypothetical protein